MSPSCAAAPHSSASPAAASSDADADADEGAEVEEGVGAASGVGDAACSAEDPPATPMRESLRCSVVRATPCLRAASRTDMSPPATAAIASSMLRCSLV